MANNALIQSCHAPYQTQAVSSISFPGKWKEGDEQKFVNPVQYVDDGFCDPLVGTWLLDDYFLLLSAQMKYLQYATTTPSCNDKTFFFPF